MADDVRDRLLEATVACLGRYGIAKTTVDDAAREAGVARATVYRHFPDGKEQLIGEAITWAVQQFFRDLAAAVAGAPDFPTLLEQAIAHAYRAVDDHVVLQKVLETEPERLLPQLTQSAPQVTEVLSAYLADELRSTDLVAGVDPDRAGEWLARMGLSFILAGGRWDLTDAAQIRELVRGELLVGIVAPQALGVTDATPETR
ncbi:MAG: TetR/AcrR family transcriptional regulator [Acidimicrobiales bacterium]|nr:TetR/AcrR family transcriptional regulator [Acidimicrobiales bacterium]